MLNQVRNSPSLTSFMIMDTGGAQLREANGVLVNLHCSLQTPTSAAYTIFPAMNPALVNVNPMGFVGVPMDAGACRDQQQIHVAG